MTSERSLRIESVFSAIESAGFVARGAFRLGVEERVGLLAAVRTIALVGVAGRRGWDAFAASPEARDGSPNPLDRLSRRVIDELAEALGAFAFYPFGGPLHWPFQQWAQRAEPVHPSPIGVLIHPVYGLWHSYRGALGLGDAFDLPDACPGASPCESCRDKPCLSACPVGAFTTAGYHVETCTSHLERAAGADCMAAGCLARRVCPVGAGHAHEPDQAKFTMRAFVHAREAAAGAE